MNWQKCQRPKAKDQKSRLEDSGLSCCFPKNLNCVRDIRMLRRGLKLWILPLALQDERQNNPEKQRNKWFSKPAPLPGESYYISVRLANQPRGMAIGSYLRVLCLLDKLGLSITVVAGGAQWHSPYLVCTRARLRGAVWRSPCETTLLCTNSRARLSLFSSVYFLECIYFF